MILKFGSDRAASNLLCSRKLWWMQLAWIVLLPLLDIVLVQHVKASANVFYSGSSLQQSELLEYLPKVRIIRKVIVDTATATDPPPKFDPNVPKNVTTQLGHTVYLHCVVHGLGDKMVSWIRWRDFHVLTVGLNAYTTDDRFQAVHMEATNDWMLQVKMAQVSDVGLYECQVNAHPLMSFFVYLTVLVPKTSIREAPDVYVKTGSSVNLTCLISQSPEPPVFVFWYHDQRMINYDWTRGEIQMQKVSNDTTMSRLVLSNVQPEDTGNYTCGPSNAEPSSVRVHVLNGEKRAAMQHDMGTSRSLSLQRHPDILLAVLLCVCTRMLNTS